MTSEQFKELRTQLERIAKALEENNHLMKQSIQNDDKFYELHYHQMDCDYYDMNRLVNPFKGES